MAKTANRIRVNVGSRKEIDRRVADCMMMAMRRGETLGYATGNTPAGAYKIMREECNGLKLKKGTYNLDEQCFIGQKLVKEDPRTFNSFMEEHLFLELRKHNQGLTEEMHRYPSDVMPDDTIWLPGMDLSAYDDEIIANGGVQTWLIGIGRGNTEDPFTGHVAFCEYFHLIGTDWLNKKSYTGPLDYSTRVNNKDYVGCNGDVDRVPDLGITIGTGTLYHCVTDRVFLVAKGLTKKLPVKGALQMQPDPSRPASILQLLSDKGVTVDFFLDHDAASELDRSDKSLLFCE